MPTTLDKPDPGRPEIGRIIEKIRRRGSDSLTPIERMMVVEIFRHAAISNHPQLRMAKHDIQKAHLEYCLRLCQK